MSNYDTPRPLKELLQMMVRRLGWSDDVMEARIKRGWQKLAGPLIARHTTRVYVHKRVLYLHVDSAPLRHELSMGKDRILQRFNHYLGEDYLTDVVVR